MRKNLSVPCASTVGGPDFIAIVFTGFPSDVTSAPGAAVNVATPFSSRRVPSVAGAFPFGRRTRLFGALPTALSPSSSHERPTSLSHGSFVLRLASRSLWKFSISAL